MSKMRTTLRITLSSLLVAVGIFGVLMEYDLVLLWWIFIFSGILYGLGEDKR